MELTSECILCTYRAKERKYFFKDNPLCTMHYAEYLEVLIGNLEGTVGGDEASSAFSAYMKTLEPIPLNEMQRIEEAKRKKEKESSSISRTENDLYTMS